MADDDDALITSAKDNVLSHIYNCIRFADEPTATLSTREKR